MFNCSLYSLEIAHITLIIHRTVNTFLSNNQLKNPTIALCLIVFIIKGLGPSKIIAMLMRQNKPDTLITDVFQIIIFGCIMKEFRSVCE